MFQSRQGFQYTVGDGPRGPAPSGTAATRTVQWAYNVRLVYTSQDDSDTVATCRRAGRRSPGAATVPALPGLAAPWPTRKLSGPALGARQRPTWRRPLLTQ